MITIVSGLPRSGTSLMMQMLRAGGMPILTDQKRVADIDNPQGYWEWEPAKLLPKEPGRIDAAEGMAVKVISELLFALPLGRDYKVIFMERPLAEVLASQEKMLARRGIDNPTDPKALTSAFREHMGQVVDWLQEREEIAVHRVGYRKLVKEPRAIARGVQTFLGVDLDVQAMAHAVDPALYRTRADAVS